MASTMISNSHNDHQATKSIDVGSMFLMDLSVQESDSALDQTSPPVYRDADNDALVFPIYHPQSQQQPALALGGDNKLFSLSAAHQLDSTRRRNNLFHPYENNFTDSSIVMNNQHEEHNLNHLDQPFQLQRVAIALEAQQTAVAPHQIHQYQQNNGGTVGAGDIIMSTNIINNNIVHADEDEDDIDLNAAADDYEDNYLAGSLDRLASAINHNNNDHHHHQHQRNHRNIINNNYTTTLEQQQQQQNVAGPINNMLGFNISNNGNNHNKRSIKPTSRRHLTSTVTVAQPQPPPELGDTWSSASSATSSSSLSLSEDESFALESSSGTSLSASFTSNELDVNGHDDQQVDRISTATREDSGVLDLKDLDSNQSNGTANIFDELASNTNNIMMDFETNSLFSNDQPNNINSTTNLITKSSTKSSLTSSANLGNSSNQRQSHNQHLQQHQSTAPLGINAARRSVSASLPIQVPARQMKKDLNKLKLTNMLMEREFEAELANDGFNDAIDEQKCDQEPQKQQMKLEPPKRTTTSSSNANNRSLLLDDEEEEFLDQEFNENHQNHYPNDELDGGNLRAEENPMKLFASIQALAKSLHEDAELFGSLPPKRLLESPIRSIALV